MVLGIIPRALVTAPLVLVGCVATTPQSALLQSCEAYVAALQAVSAAAVRGRLSSEQVRSVGEITMMLNPVCERPPGAGDSAAVILGSVRKGLQTLLLYTATSGAPS